jgi:hypothetical protein
LGGTTPNFTAACHDTVDDEVYVVGYRTNPGVDDARIWRIEIAPLITDVPIVYPPYVYMTVPLVGVQMVLREETDLEAPFGINDPQAIAYDFEEDALVLFSGIPVGGGATDSKWIKMERKSYDFMDEVDPAPFVVEHNLSQSFQQGVKNGVLMIHDGLSGIPPVNDYTRLRTTDMSYESVDGFVPGGAGGLIAHTYFYAETNSTLVGAEGGLVTVTRQYHDRTTAGAANLDEVLDDLVSRAGLDPATDVEYDASVQAATVGGMLQMKQSPVRQVIEPLTFAYNFDGVESDDKIKFVTRGLAAAVDTIEEDELGVQSGKPKPIQNLVEIRGMEVEISEDLFVQHYEKKRQYVEGTQHASRPRVYEPDTPIIQRSYSNATVSLPMTLTAKEAKEIAEKQLYQAWNDLVGYSLSVGPRHLRLDPTDVVTVNLGSNAFSLRLSRSTLGDALVSEMEATSNDAELFTSDTEAPEVSVVDPPLTPPGPTELFVLDIPLLYDTDASGQSSSGVYVAFGAHNDAWRGAVAQVSTDGITWVTMEAAVEGVPWGYVTSGAVDPLPPTETTDERPCEWNGRITTWDRETEIRFEAMDGGGEWTSLTETQVLNGFNKAIIVSREQVEVIQFATAFDHGDGTITIAALLRGRRGTEPAAEAGHSAGAKVLLVDSDWVYRAPLSLDQVGVNLWVRAPSLGTIITNTSVETFTLAGNDLKPYPVAHVERDAPPGATRDPLVLTWLRRTRLGGEMDWGDAFEDVVMGETIEEYDVVLLDPSGTDEELVKTVTSETASFTDAEQLAAGYSTGDPLEVVIYQKSAVVGRGYGRSCTV